MKRKTFIAVTIVVVLSGCGAGERVKNWSPFKKEEATLEPKKGSPSSTTQRSEEIFVCAGDIDVTYKKLGEVSLGEYGFSGHDILASKIREKARDVGAQAVINVQYDTGASKTWKGYGELGGTDYGIKNTSWCKGTAITFLESYNSLGLLLCSVTRENREWYGLKKKHAGVLVVSVMPGSIAAGSGIKAEDLLTEWDGTKIETKNQLRQLIESSAGKTVKLSAIYAGELKVITLTVPASARNRAVPSVSKSAQTEKKPVVERKAPSSSGASRKNLDVYNEVGDLYLRKGMYDEAIDEYKKAIEADPDCAIAHFNLSIAYDKKGMKEEADEEYAAYRRLKPKRKE